MKLDITLPFKGEHCETTALGILMSHLGYDFSEAMLFGLGQGLNYGILTWGSDGFPFIGGRIKPPEVTENICRNLGLNLTMKKTRSPKKAWQTVKDYLDSGVPVALQLDSYHLEYFTSKIHFAGHFVAIIGYDEEYAYLVDTIQQGGLTKTKLKNLELARNEKGPMCGNNLSMTIEKGYADIPLQDAIRRAVVNTAKAFLNPPISNFGYKGIHRTAKELKKWYKNSKDVAKDFPFTATMMERAGTGGALFRNIYRDFLKEAYDITGYETLLVAHNNFAQSAKLWNKVAQLYTTIGETKDEDLLSQASSTLLEIEDLEVATMNLLLTL